MRALECNAANGPTILSVSYLFVPLLHQNTIFCKISRTALKIEIFNKSKHKSVIWSKHFCQNTKWTVLLVPHLPIAHNMYYYFFLLEPATGRQMGNTGIFFLSSFYSVLKVITQIRAYWAYPGLVLYIGTEHTKYL